MSCNFPKFHQPIPSGSNALNMSIIIAKSGTAKVPIQKSGFCITWNARPYLKSCQIKVVFFTKVNAKKFVKVEESQPTQVGMNIMNMRTVWNSPPVEYLRLFSHQVRNQNDAVWSNLWACLEPLPRLYPLAPSVTYVKKKVRFDATSYTSGKKLGRSE